MFAVMGSAPYLYAGELQKQPNVLTLLVSATPFNVLGQPSYIKAEPSIKDAPNIIHWIRSGETGGAYMRLEDYLLTIPRHEQDPTSAVRPKVRDDPLFDRNFPNGLKSVKTAERDYILMADYVFSFCFFAVFRWDKELGCLKDIQTCRQEVGDSAASRAAEFLRWYSMLIGIDSQSSLLLTEGWDQPSIKKLSKLGQRLLKHRLGDAASISDAATVKDGLLAILNEDTAVSETDPIVEDLLRSSSGEVMELPDGSKKRVLCGRMTIIRVPPIRIGTVP